MPFVGSSRFTNLSSRNAILIIAAVIFSIIYGLWVGSPINPKESKGADLLLYRSIVERISGGEPYYDVTGEELRARGYASHSVFNWRLPTLAWLLGHLPSVKIGQALTAILASLSLFLWMTVFHRKQYSLKQLMAAGLLLAGPVIYGLLPDPCLMHEVWAGTLIMLSLAAHGSGWRYTSVLCGILALLLRELTLPFVLVMLILAYRDGYRHEAFAWLIGAVVFGGGLLIHWTIVNKLITENDLALRGGWIVFGGWRFVLDTARMQPALLIAPPWVTAVLVPLALLGLAAWRGPLGSRVAATVGIYILAFSIVGLPFNKYWGLMYAHLLPLGFLFVPYAFRDLWVPINNIMRKRHKENLWLVR